jgi:GntR family transcriptional repressor for pyruvate dehydrogenase complex
MPHRDNAAPAIRPISRFKISDSVAAQIEQLIKGGSYKPGDKLPSERVLSEEFGVGRSSMREALRALEARGFVSIAHGLGVYVADSPGVTDQQAIDLLVLDECTVPELFEVRRALECPAAALAAKRITQPEAAKLEEILAASHDTRLSDSEFVEKDAELHRTIVHATRNKLLIRVYGSTQHLFIEYSSRVIRLSGRREKADSGHAEIVAAVVNRKPQAAQRAMSAHLEAVERDIVEYLNTAGLRGAGAIGEFGTESATAGA